MLCFHQTNCLRDEINRLKFSYILCILCQSTMKTFLIITMDRSQINSLEDKVADRNRESFVYCVYQSTVEEI